MPTKQRELSGIIRDAILPLDSEDRTNVLIIDDSMFERNRSKKVELLTKVYDHAKHKYRFGFRMLTLGWSDGSTFLPVNSILLSTESKKRVPKYFLRLLEYYVRMKQMGQEKKEV